ncbi:hypothetical protein Patl1_06224 [Pistacia atlantica]|uniref:Uncharacterized protein n=1 Tax=Pistacia atlantica TaxID=434234 RepID=A0ACC1BRV8_9ROSI|nr:hypothetical protein Patl1_06224 [Pistacia atlantica]
MIGWWNVDCGSTVQRLGPNSLMWTTDKDFTKFGFNKLVARRFFYGNYDGNSSPPTFDLYIDNIKWSTVNTYTIGGPIYVEALHMTRGFGSIRVCLRQTNEAEIPFISSLEAVPFCVYLYKKMESNATFALVNRVNFGRNEVRFSASFSEEKYNRIWTQAATPWDCIEARTLPDSTALPDSDAPDSVLRSSIVSPNIFTPITLSVDLPPNQATPQTAYFVFYFTEVVKRTASNDRRIVDIYINGMKMDTVEAEVNKCKVVTLYPVTVVGPTINITLRPASFSTLPPMISAMEVFTRIVYGPAHGNILTSGTQDHFISVYLTLIQVFLLVNALINI